MEPKAKRRGWITWAFLCAAIAAHFTHWYFFGDGLHERWREWHKQSIAVVQSELRSESATNIPVLPYRLKPELAAKYNEGVKLAQRWREVNSSLAEQSGETIKVLSVAADVLDSKNHVALDAISPRIKAVIAEQQEAEAALVEQNLAIEQWEQQLKEFWSQHRQTQEIEVNFPTNFKPQTLKGIEGREKIEKLYKMQNADLEQAIDLLSQSPGTPSPYAEEKLEVLRARIKLATLIVRTLDSAYIAFDENLSRAPLRPQLVARQEELALKYASLQEKVSLAKGSDK